MSPVVDRLAELRRHLDHLLERVVQALDRLAPLQEFVEAVRRIEAAEP